MASASAFEAEGCRFEPCRGRPRISPGRRRLLASGNLVEPRARGWSRVSRQFGQGKERCPGNLRIRLLRMHNREGTHNIDNDVIAAGGVGVEEDAVQHRWSGEVYPCFFAQFA